MSRPWAALYLRGVDQIMDKVERLIRAPKPSSDMQPAPRDEKQPTGGNMKRSGDHGVGGLEMFGLELGFIAADQFLPQGRQLYSLWRLEGARSYEGYCRHMTPARSPPSTNRAIVSTPQCLSRPCLRMTSKRDTMCGEDAGTGEILRADSTGGDGWDGR
ncbi:hypothetical protein BU26DRAFT_504797 [Trematosphaeria pertusa]|uniref:Uncharacterized protein n=1 Tax=Trematosphaeria pertusa TaxID=390896 RepID=A0A6A6IFE4_9PLEO|nr:uncharacterized protein BU26DRAFT_504797 [Trematosphaeria pertusa]KAF2248622.1 hypothetical protein BU26DRAFT_504797 [Trematosphaeria pertusa]